MKITLSPEWEKIAADIGRQRQEYAEAHNLKNYGGRCFAREFALENHIMGARAEAATAKACHVPWRPTVDRSGGIDVDGRIEVRGRRMPGTGHLSMRPPHKNELPYVLVHAFRPFQCGGVLDVIGWLWGHEMTARGGPCHFGVTYIAPPYRSDVSLIERFGNVDKKNASGT